MKITLTRLQRIINPIERLVFTFLFLFVLGFGLWAVICSNGIQQLIIGIVIILPLLLLRKSIISLCLSLKSEKYINMIEIKDNELYFGIDSMQAKISCKLFKLSKGLCGTFVLRHPSGLSIVIPKGSIKELNL